MNRLERMTLIKLAVRDLDEAVAFYTPVCGECAKWCTEEAIRRRIVTVRADLKKLEEELRLPISG